MSVDPKSSYYDAGGIETIEIIKAKLTGAELTPVQAYLLGNIIKYACRLPWRGQADRDSEKLVTYSTMLKGELK